MSVQVNLFKLALVTFVAVTLVVFGDTAGKLLTALGVAPGLVAWSRFALAAVLLSGIEPTTSPLQRNIFIIVK